MTVIRSQCKDEAEYRQALRDVFAAAAMQGLATNQSLLLNDAELVDRIGTLAIDKLQANKAYRLADAMLEERNKP